MNMKLLALLLFNVSVALASCSGSGLTWSCTSGTTAAQVSTVISSASDGATITFANGSYSWSSVISLNNIDGVTLVCETVRGCTVSFSSHDVFTRDAVTSNITTPFRISGFVFSGTVGTAAIWLYGGSNIESLRIDHNTFTIGASEIAVLLGEISSTGKIYGLMDNNICTATNNFMCLKNISGGNGSSNWQTGHQGSGGGASSFFFEDNECNFTNNPDLGTGCVDVWRANSTVLRYNTLTNARFVNHSYCHEGPYNSEIYRNTINDAAASPANYRNIHFQGSGEEIVWGNTVEINGSGNTIVIQHFRGDSSTATSEGSCNSLCDGTVTGTGASASTPNDGNRSGQSGYPCWHQPGRDKNGTLRPVYGFLNQNAAGTKVDISLNSGGNAPSQFAANRDYYDSVSLTAQTSSSSPFNGTVGVGHGTLANRPTTCTATAQAEDAGHGGVAYWVTDQGEWNSRSAGADGRLDVCTATNTWTEGYYVPYTYPHPLQGAASSSPAKSGGGASHGGGVKIGDE